VKDDIFTKNLRFMWMVACYESDNIPMVTKACTGFFRKLSTNKSFIYNHKNCIEIAQLFNHMFPAPINTYHNALNSNDSAQIAYMDSDDYLNSKDLFENPFRNLFRKIFKMYVTSFYVLESNSRANADIKSHITYIESYSSEWNMIIMKPPLYLTFSAWENHFAT
jgi:hypothetical protein